MKRQITHISVVQTAKVFAVLALVSFLPFWLLMAIPMMGMPGPQPAFFSGFFLVMPVLNAVFAFLFAASGAWLYNVLFKYVGGIEFTSVEVPGGGETLVPGPTVSR